MLVLPLRQSGIFASLVPDRSESPILDANFENVNRLGDCHWLWACPVPRVLAGDSNERTFVAQFGYCFLFFFMSILLWGIFGFGAADWGAQTSVRFRSAKLNAMLAEHWEDSFSFSVAALTRTASCSATKFPKWSLKEFSKHGSRSRGRGNEHTFNTCWATRRASHNTATLLPALMGIY